MSRPDHAAFDPDAYGPVFASLVGDEPAMPLGAGEPDETRRPSFEPLTRAAAFIDRPILDHGAADCCLASAWLLHGFLDEAHALCQEVGDASGSYLHGVVHRREGDYGNAQYWFRRAGEHPIDPLLASAAAGRPETVELALGGRWDAVGFVDAVRRATRTGGELADACVAVQRAEWRALFDHSWRRAVGG
ncbi:MAG: hypothetical protein AAF805_08790 [Planctomycetota bacterium]